MVKLPIKAIIVPSDRMRRLRPEVVEQLVGSMQHDGLLQPIGVHRYGQRYKLGFGRHRLEAAQRLGWSRIEAKILNGHGQAALLAEIDENLCRAELSAAERALHLAARKRLYEALHPQTRHGGDRRSANSTRQNGDLKRFTKDAVAKVGKSERSLQREVARAAIVGLADLVGTSLDFGDELDALLKLPRSIQRQLVARAKRGERVRAKHFNLKVQAEARRAEFFKPTAIDANRLHVGDFRRLAPKLIADASIELVLTDPPWGRDGISLYDDIAREAARILKPGGSLIVYVGQIGLPDALPAMAKHLRYFWCCADVRADSNSRIPNGVINGFVPLLWFVKGHRGDRQNYVRDVVINGGKPEKLWHPWQQPLATAEHFIGALTSASGTVVDFMAGAGTTIVAARALGRKWLAFESDRNAAASMRARLRHETHKLPLRALGKGLVVAGHDADPKRANGHYLAS
jgi:ParB family transcriptional regulator, chromosome partitioning protein